MLQDWVPARTSLAAGVVVKQHVLERNKYPLPQANITSSIAFVGSSSTNIPYLTENILITGSSIQMGYIEGSDGGVISDNIKLIYSTSSFSLVNSATETFTVNLGSSGVYNVIADVIISGGDPITDNNLNLYNSNETGSNELIYNKIATSSPLKYTLNQTFNLTSGYLTFAQSSSQFPDPITITNLKIYLDPSYYQLVETPYGDFEQLVTNEYDFNGELEGTNLIVTDGDLNGDNTFLNYPRIPTNYTPTLYRSSTVAISTFLLSTVIPGSGQIYLFYDTGSNTFPVD
jgi:hypothetical protein